MIKVTIVPINRGHYAKFTFPKPFADLLNNVSGGAAAVLKSYGTTSR